MIGRNYSNNIACGLSSLRVRDFLKSIQLENLAELFEREQVSSDNVRLHHVTSCDLRLPWMY